MTTRKNLTYHITYVAMCVSLLTVSAWIAIPFVISFTLQPLAVFLIAAVSHWKQSVTAVLLYLTLGCLGAPVFAGFQGGPSVFLQATGGYLIGFIGATLIIGWCIQAMGRSKRTLLLSMLVALVFCYACGTLAYMTVYVRSDASISLFAALFACVFPYVLPDLLKIALAIWLTAKLFPLLQRIKS